MQRLEIYVCALSTSVGKGVGTGLSMEWKCIPTCGTRTAIMSSILSPSEQITKFTPAACLHVEAVCLSTIGLRK